MRVTGFLALLLPSGLALLCDGSAQAQPAFVRKDILVPGQYGSIEIQVSAGRITTGDFNGDGRPDLIVSSGRGISVLLNAGGGNFGPPVHNEYNPCGPLVAADLNGDGKLDLIAANPCRSSGHILLGRGDGTFSAPREVTGLAMFAAVGDFNGDGKPDLVSRDGALLGNGDGTFRSGVGFRQPGLMYPDSELVEADFNHDGKADVAARFRSGDGYTVSVFLGQGDGAFQAPISVSARAATMVEFNGRATTLLAADLNEDGLPDLITGLDVLLGNGDGSFQLPRRYFTPESEIDRPVPFAAVDFDGDGHLDLAVGSRYLYAASNHVLIFRGKGDGTVMPPTEHAVGWQPGAGAVADLDGDGRPDLVTANLASNTVSLLLNRVGADSPQIRAVSTASGTAVVAPGSLATLYVSTAVTVAAKAGSSPWPTRLGGISLEIRDNGGDASPAPLRYVSGTQIDFLVPEDAAIGESTLAIVTDTGSTQAGTMQVGAVAPGLFMMTDYSLMPAAFNERVESDGSRSSHPLFDCSAPKACLPLPLGRWAAGSDLILYGTGFRNATSANVECSISGERMVVEDAGSQGALGLDRIRVRLPSEQAEFWDYSNSTGEVVLSIDGVLANRALLFFSRQP